MAKVIDYMIVGMQKCGTSSMKHFVSQHPAIDTHQATEMTFFYNDDEFALGWERVCGRYFKGTIDSKIVAKHSILMCKRKSLRRLQIHNPDVKVIICLRNPVNRAYSSYNMEYANGADDYKNFRKVIHKVVHNGKVNIEDWRERTYIGFGIYAPYLEDALDLFGSKNVYIHVLENPNYSRLFSFLGLPEVTLKESIRNGSKRSRNQTIQKVINYLIAEKHPYKRHIKSIIGHRNSALFGERIRQMNQKKNNYEMDDNMKALASFYRPYNQILKKEFDVDVSSWK